jgi:hypothetical protein
VNNLLSFLAEHGVAISGALLYALLAGISTMPPKGTKWTADTIYDWFYDWTHLLVNQRGQSRKLPLDQTQQPTA